MLNQITVTGMVLQSAPNGEYDRRVVILTRERGKISAFASGARRPNNQLRAATMPFAFGQFNLSEGRNSYKLLSAEISNHFEHFMTDIEGMCYGTYFMELAMYYGREANDETELLKLLYQSLRALQSKSIPNRLVRAIFELKIITINGEGPQVFECVVCGDQDPAHEKKFSVRRGGLVCERCGIHFPDKISLLPSTLHTLQYIEATPTEKLYTFVVKREVLEQLEDLMERYLDEYIGKRFKSLEILETIVD